MTDDKPALVTGITAAASATVTRGPQTLARIAAGELNPDGTPTGKQEQE